MIKIMLSNAELINVVVLYICSFVIRNQTLDA